MRRALQTPEIRNAIAQTGDVPQGTIAEFNELLAREYPRWSKAVNTANVKVD